MARLDLRHPDNVPGEWFADTRCIDCDVARHYAPALIGADADGRSVVIRQPSKPEDEAALWRAVLACPTRSIGTAPHRPTPPGVFPYELEPGLFLCGHNDESSFGAHSYLVVRPEGNLLVDSPRFTRALVEPIERLGGLAHILLTHRDDVADADRYADRFGARVWIHDADASSAPYATDRLSGAGPSEVATIEPGLVGIPVPGHTRGSVVFLLDETYLFTGDSLHWNHRRGALDVFAGATWFSWPALCDSMAGIAGLRTEWVLPGHGMWGHVGAEGYRSGMATLVRDLRAVERRDWSRQPPAAAPAPYG